MSNTKLYLAVTPDRYELPIAVCDSPKELGSLFGIDDTVVYAGIRRNLSGKTRGAKFIKVEVGDESEY